MKSNNRKRHITLARNDNDRNAPAPAAAHVADAELEWFFTMAESDTGSRSNYTQMILPKMHRPDSGSP